MCLKVKWMQWIKFASKDRFLQINETIICYKKCCNKFKTPIGDATKNN